MDVDAIERAEQAEQAGGAEPGEPGKQARLAEQGDLSDPADLAVVPPRDVAQAPAANLDAASAPRNVEPIAETLAPAPGAPGHAGFEFALGSEASLSPLTLSPLTLFAMVAMLFAMVLAGVLGWQLLRLARTNRAALAASEQAAATSARAEQALRDELRAQRTESSEAARDLRGEVATGLHGSSELMVGTLSEMGKAQNAQLEAVTKQLGTLTEANENRIERLRKTIDHQLRELQQSNEKKLDAMRQTVDETLQSTLEKRLGESFKLVGDRLEAVQKGLGEMRSLASGVGDLKRVLTNVKTRGVWGEVQLEAILEQVLTPEQYDRNVQTKEGSRENVEFAIRLPGGSESSRGTSSESSAVGGGGHSGGHVWLPIDSKFPQEDYLRLQEAAEEGNREAVDLTSAALERAIMVAAKDISSKYVNPPRTTDFALLFLPTEGLYAEVVRRPGLIEKLQREHRIVIAGPTTLAALLNSLRMGFRTLAIQERASEVWSTLSAVKAEFGKFGAVLEKVKKQLDTASNTIEQTGVRTRKIERRLKDVETLPAAEVGGILGADLIEIADGAGLAGVDAEEDDGDAC